MDEATRTCIANCVSCQAVCLQTVVRCLELGGAHAAPLHIAALIDCAEACQASANFMLRGSELHARVCEMCAAACERCADECERFPDDFMRRCAEACRKAADSCYEMAEAGPPKADAA
jgi:hypothetical protein